MKNVFYLCTTFMLLSMSCAFAQKQVSFTSHKTGSVVTSQQITVEGTANNVPDDGHVWILVQRAGFNGWYPQGRGERLPQENWTCIVFLGETDLDKGKYDIAVVVVNDEVHRKLAIWVQTAEREGKYPAIDFPVVIGSNYQAFITVDRR
ncbi:MAG: hypothetical protein FWC41_10465 [Firmicutes bacterium]|nr:hypothetical protein [Bacillota bacterium]